MGLPATIPSTAGGFRGGAATGALTGGMSLSLDVEGAADLFITSTGYHALGLAGGALLSKLFPANKPAGDSRLMWSAEIVLQLFGTSLAMLTSSQIMDSVPTMSTTETYATRNFRETTGRLVNLVTMLHMQPSIGAKMAYLRDDMDSIMAKLTGSASASASS